jgi:ATP-binding cassette subfamily F protein uup
MRLGGKILELEGVGKSFNGQSFIDSLSFSFRKGDKLGIIGPNGSGKTTLLNIITGRLEPDKGSVDIGINTKIGYYDQLLKELPGDLKASDYIKETAEVIKLKDGSIISPTQFLERFLFPKNMLYTEISNLSGGERKKLYLLKLLLENPNFIVFDEPTNDFDIQTLSILENFLENFAGCAVVVSHDRFFLDRTVDFLLVLDGTGGIKGFSGSASEYYSSDIDATSEDDKTAEAKASAGKKAVNRQKKGLSFNEKKELETIEEAIMLLENEKAELDKFFSSPAAASADLNQKTKHYDAVIMKINDRYSRWEYLESLK